MILPTPGTETSLPVGCATEDEAGAAPHCRVSTMRLVGSGAVPSCVQRLSVDHGNRSVGVGTRYRNLKGEQI
jgi:hypothetical protein